MKWQPSVVVGQAKILRQVDDAHIGGDIMLGQELCALAVTEAEENYVDFFEWQLVGEVQIRFAVQTSVHIGHRIACITFAMGKDNFCSRMIQQQTDEFASCITCCANDTYFYQIVHLNGFCGMMA